MKSGTVLGSTYRIRRLIGEGGAGLVYEAEHVSLGSRVAVKVLFAHLGRIEQIRDRFVEEAQIQAQLRHPNLVSVVDIIDEGWLVAMVMEYVDGQTLDAFIREHHPVDQATCLRLAFGMLAGLNYAHRAGIIHRDIKPENVLLQQVDEEWVPKISDFGIAKVLAADRRTRTGAKMGTVLYMAPEQIADSSTVDARADIYAVGVTLYELVTGRPPFESENVYSLMAMHRDAPVPDPTALRGDLHGGIRDVIVKALAKKRDDRFATVAEMAEGLKAVDLSAPPRPPEVRVVAALDQPANREPAVAAPPPPPLAALGSEAALEAALDETEPDGHQAVPALSATREAPPAPRPFPPGARVPAADRFGDSGTSREEAALELAFDRSAERSRSTRSVPATEGLIPRPRRRRLDLDRWLRVSLAVAVLVALYQAFPLAHCMVEALDAHGVASDNDAAFNPAGYSRLDEEGANEVARAEGFGGALSTGFSVCRQQSGFGHGHSSLFNVLLSLAAISALALYVAGRIGRSSLARAATPPALGPRGAGTGQHSRVYERASGEHPEVGDRGRLLELTGSPELPVGRDFYLSLVARDLAPDELSRVSVKAVVRCELGRAIPVWIGSRPLTRLLAHVPSGQVLSTLPFIVPFEEVRRALEDGGQPLRVAKEIRFRAELGGQRVEHRTRLKPL